MASRRSSSLESAKLERLHVGGIDEYLERPVPAPLFSGQDKLHVPSGISFAPETIEFATPVIHGTLMSEFDSDPKVLRDGDDMFPAENFAHLIITVGGVRCYFTSSTHPTRPHPVARPPMGVGRPYVKHC